MLSSTYSESAKHDVVSFDFAVISNEFNFSSPQLSAVYTHEFLRFYTETKTITNLTNR